MLNLILKSFSNNGRRYYTTENLLAGEARIRQKLHDVFKPTKLQVEDVSGIVLFSC